MNLGSQLDFPVDLNECTLVYYSQQDRGFIETATHSYGDISSEASGKSSWQD